MVAWPFLCKRMLRFNMCSMLILDTHKYGTLQRVTNPGQGWRARWPTVPSPLQMQMDHHWQQCGLCNLATQSRTALSESKNCFFKKGFSQKLKYIQSSNCLQLGCLLAFSTRKYRALGSSVHSQKQLPPQYETPLFT